MTTIVFRMWAAFQLITRVKSSVLGIMKELLPPHLFTIYWNIKIKSWRWRRRRRSWDISGSRGLLVIKHWQDTEWLDVTVNQDDEEEAQLRLHGEIRPSSSLGTWITSRCETSLSLCMRSFPVRGVGGRPRAGVQLPLDLAPFCIVILL